jgi:ABC-type multidrug transport system ATPase subunit
MEIKDPDCNREGWGTYLTTVGYCTAGGAIIGGMPGALIGTIAGIVDEHLINQNISEKHYLSSSIFWSSTVIPPAVSFLSGIFPRYSLPIAILSYGVSAVAVPYFAQDFLDFNSQINIPFEAFSKVNHFFDQKEVLSFKEAKKIYDCFFNDPAKAYEMLINDIQNIYNNPLFYNCAEINLLNLINIVVKGLSLRFFAEYKSNLFISSHLKNSGSVLENLSEPLSHANFTKWLPSLLEFGSQGIVILSAYLIQRAIQYAIEVRNTGLDEECYRLLSEKAADITVNSGRDILNDEKGREIIDNMPRDLYMLLFRGTAQLNNFFSKSMEALIALKSIIDYAPDALFAYLATLIPMQILLEKMANIIKQVEEDLAESVVKTCAAQNEIIIKMEEIHLRDAKHFTTEQYKKTLATMSLFREKSKYFEVINRGMSTLQEMSHRFIDIAYFGLKLAAKQIPLQQVPLIRESIDIVNTFLSHKVNFQIYNKGILISRNRIERLLNCLESQEKKNINSNQKHKIIIDNYTLKSENTELFKIDHLELDEGKRYAISGKSGCGKTSFIKDLKIGVSKGQSSFGEITLGNQDTKVIYLDQKLYIPQNFSVIESIYFPNQVDQLTDQEKLDLVEQVTSLLKEIMIDDLESDNTLINKLNSSDFNLSEGQSKKMGIIQAILSKPDILFLDETFTGLDKKSITNIQNLLNNYLPNCLIISIDHHAKENNNNQFYDSQIHIVNGKLEVQAS